MIGHGFTTLLFEEGNFIEHHFDVLPLLFELGPALLQLRQKMLNLSRFISG